MANGVFFDRYPMTPAVFSPIAISLDHIANGVSNTLMLSENIQAGPYVAGGPFDNDNPLSYDNSGSTWSFSDAERLTGFVWMVGPTFTPKASGPQDPKFALKINGDKLKRYVPTPANPDYLHARPSSNHPGGVNVAMCGGETFFMREDVDYPVYQQLMTSNYKKSDMTQAINITPNLGPLSDDQWK